MDNFDMMNLTSWKQHHNGKLLKIAEELGLIYCNIIKNYYFAPEKWFLVLTFVTPDHPSVCSYGWSQKRALSVAVLCVSWPSQPDTLTTP